MLGFFSGIVLAIWFRNEGPQQPVYEWMVEEEEDEEGKTEIGREGEEEKVS